MLSSAGGRGEVPWRLRKRTGRGNPAQPVHRSAAWGEDEEAHVLKQVCSDLAPFAYPVHFNSLRQMRGGPGGQGYASAGDRESNGTGCSGWGQSFAACSRAPRLVELCALVFAPFLVSHVDDLRTTEKSRAGWAGRNETHSLSTGKKKQLVQCIFSPSLA